MRILLLVFLIVVVIFSITNARNVKENYSSLSTIYPENVKREKSTCNGITEQSIVSNRDNKKCRENNTKDTSPDKFKCIDDPTMKSLIGANYVYIYSNPFKKLLAFDTYGTQSYIYVDPRTPTNNQCLTKDEYEEYVGNRVDTLPQKWRINIKSYLNPDLCLVSISSYGYEKPTYYLTAGKDGNLSVSLIDGGDDQTWQISKQKENDDDYNGEDSAYLIKSYKHCLYLTASNQGYTKKNSGLVSLTGIRAEYVGKELLWNIMTCGKRKIASMPDKETYQPFQSTYDFPWESRTKTGINKDDYGRSVWMKEFNKVWNGQYTYEKIIEQNTLKKLDVIAGNFYRVVTKENKIKLNAIINLENNNKVIRNTGSVSIEIIGEPTIKEEKVPGTLVREDKEVKDKTYKKYVYPKKETFVFDVKTYGADILRGYKSGKEIFLSKVKDDERSVQVTVMDMGGDIVLKEIIMK